MKTFFEFYQNIFERLFLIALITAGILLLCGLCTGCTIDPLPKIPGTEGPELPKFSEMSARMKVDYLAAQSGSTLSYYGTLAVLAGAIACAVPAAPNGLGYGLIGGGLLCILSGILLPAFALWIGVGIVIISMIIYLPRLAAFLPRKFRPLNSNSSKPKK